MGLEINNLDEIRTIAKKFLEQTQSFRVFILNGPMGVGKTTFVKAICQELGVTDAVNSPTFSIVNEYCGRDNLLIYHFDFYRIEDEIEAYDFGCDEYLNSGNYCFLEWAERIPNLIPEQALVVTLSEEENGCRIISF